MSFFTALAGASLALLVLWDVFVVIVLTRRGARHMLKPAKKDGKALNIL